MATAVAVGTGVAPVGTGVGEEPPGGWGVGGGVPTVGVGGKGMTDGIGVGVPESEAGVAVGATGFVIVLESLQPPAAASRTAAPRRPARWMEVTSLLAFS